MTERIPLDDPKLIEREQKAIADLTALYPDGVVKFLDEKDKSLGKRLSRLYRAIGYETRTDMLKAFGFMPAVGSSGGRPVSVDPEALLGELASRYEGCSKPKAYGQILHDNPDLKAPLKTLSNKSRELFGHTLNAELVERGILDQKGTRAKTDVPDVDLQELVAFLVEIYGNREDKPNKYTSLSRDLPELAGELEILRRRSWSLFGESIISHLNRLGVLAPKASDYSREDIEEVFEAIRASLFEADGGLPATVTALQEAFPEYVEVFKAAKQQGLFTKDQLIERGLVRERRVNADRERLEARRNNVRNASLEELIALYRRSIGEDMVLPDSSMQELLPRGVVGVDIPRGVELRDMVLTLSSSSTSPVVGASLIPRFLKEESWDASIEFVANTQAEWPVAVLQRCYCPLLDGLRRESESPLAAFESCLVVSKNEASVDGRFYFQVRFKFLHELEKETLLYALVQNGSITREQLREGSDEYWAMVEASNDEAVQGENETNAASVDEAVVESDVELSDEVDIVDIDEVADEEIEQIDDGAVVDGIGEESPREEREEEVWHQGGQGERFAASNTNESLISGGMPDDEAALQALQMVYLLAQADNKALPENLKNEVERKLAGDPSIDAWNLVERVTDALPDLVKGEITSLTFNQQKTAVGPDLSLMVPDQWRIIYNYEEDNLLMNVVRPFIIVPADAKEQASYANSDKILYSQNPLSEDVPVDAREGRQLAGIPILIEAMTMKSAYELGTGLASLKPHPVKMEKVRARNCECLIFQMEKDEGYEFYVHPLAHVTHDFLRFDLCQQEKANPAEVEHFVRSIASTFIVNNNAPSQMESMLIDACARPVDPDELIKAVVGFTNLFALVKEVMTDAWKFRSIWEMDELDAKKAFLDQVRGLAYVQQHAIPYLQKMLDAYSLQQRSGIARNRLEEIADAIREFERNTLAGLDQIGDDDVPLVRRSGILDETDEIRAIKARMQQVLGPMQNMNGGMRVGAANSRPMDVQERVAGNSAENRTSAMGNHPWPPQTQGVRETHVHVEYMTPEKAAHLQRMESALTGESLEAYNIIGSMGGAVELTTIGEQLSSHRDPLRLYRFSITSLLQDGLLVERVEPAPLAGEETKCKRFYTWRQVDQSGKPHWDWQAYQQWLYGRLEMLSHAGELANLGNIRAGMEAELKRCGLFEKKKKKALKAQMADIDMRMSMLGGEAAKNARSVEDLSRRLHVLTTWLQSGGGR